MSRNTTHVEMCIDERIKREGNKGTCKAKTPQI
jgi:hypothetical protein